MKYLSINALHVKQWYKAIFMHNSSYCCSAS